MRTIVVLLVVLLFPVQFQAQGLRTPPITGQPVEAANPGTVPTVNSTAEPRTAWVRHYGSQNLPSKEQAQYAAVGRLGDLFVLGTVEQSYPPAGGMYPLTVMIGESCQMHLVVTVQEDASGSPIPSTRCLLRSSS